ncbi:protein spire-like isoform X1 [Penaeus indicus]|uniref:protein spire-like isoform X1 n=1 Tax=Penaeus indicus TaxID=29960 RepID=UPI00300D88AC
MVLPRVKPHTLSLQFNISEHIVKRIQVTEHEESVSHSASTHILPQDLQLPGNSTGSGNAERRSSVSGSVGSAPSSPTLTRAVEGPASLPAQSPAPYVNEAIKKPKLVRSQTLGVAESKTARQRLLAQKQKQRSRTTQAEERLRGELMIVCGDCKAMVLHILASIRVRREQQQGTSSQHESPRHHLHLNLHPVYN